MASDSSEITSAQLGEQLERLKLENVKSDGTDDKAVIGKGSYGRVIKVYVHGTLCAAKEVHSILVEQVTSRELEVTKQTFLSECVKASRILHPNVVQMLGVYYPSSQAKLPWLVMELMETSLRCFLEKYSAEKVPLHVKLSILVDTSQGLEFLHGQNIIHRDLSSNNILLTKYLVAKIADLGVAKVVEQNRMKTQTQTPGTLFFMPPEVLLVRPRYSKPVDVFSLACVALHVMSHQWPEPKDLFHEGTMIARTEVQRREEYLKFCTQPLKQLTQLCLHNQPECRPEIAVVCVTLKESMSAVDHQESFATANQIELLDIIQQRNLENQKLQESLNNAEASLIESKRYISQLEEQLREQQDQIKSLQKHSKQNELVAQNQGDDLCMHLPTQTTVQWREHSGRKQNLVDEMSEFTKEGDRVNPTDLQLRLAKELVHDKDIIRYTKIPFGDIIRSNQGEGHMDIMAMAFDVLFCYTVNILKLKRPRNWHTMEFTDAYFKARADCMVGTRSILKIMGYTQPVLGEDGKLDGLSYPDPSQVVQGDIKLIAAELLIAKTEIKFAQEYNMLIDPSVVPGPSNVYLEGPNPIRLDLDEMCTSNVNSPYGPPQTSSREFASQYGTVPPNNHSNLHVPSQYESIPPSDYGSSHLASQYDQVQPSNSSSNPVTTVPEWPLYNLEMSTSNVNVPCVPPKTCGRRPLPTNSSSDSVTSEPEGPLYNLEMLTSNVNVPYVPPKTCGRRPLPTNPSSNPVTSEPEWPLYNLEMSTANVNVPYVPPETSGRRPLPTNSSGDSVTSEPEGPLYNLEMFPSNVNVPYVPSKTSGRRPLPTNPSSDLVTSEPEWPLYNLEMSTSNVNVPYVPPKTSERQTLPTNSSSDSVTSEPEWPLYNLEMSTSNVSLPYMPPMTCSRQFPTLYDQPPPSNHSSNPVTTAPERPSHNLHEMYSSNLSPPCGPPQTNGRQFPSQYGPIPPNNYSGSLVSSWYNQDLPPVKPRRHHANPEGRNYSADTHMQHPDSHIQSNFSGNQESKWQGSQQRDDDSSHNVFLEGVESVEDVRTIPVNEKLETLKRKKQIDDRRCFRNTSY